MAREREMEVGAGGGKEKRQNKHTTNKNITSQTKRTQSGSRHSVTQVTDA